jgi:hypothetical protein
MGENVLHQITLNFLNTFKVIGTIDANDPMYEKKINAIKNILHEDRIDTILKIIAERLPSNVRESAIKKIGRLFKTHYQGGPEMLDLVENMVENPFYLVAGNLYDEQMDLIQTLSNHYNYLSPIFFEEIIKEQPGDMGPAELMLASFTTLRKGSKGDLYDEYSDRAIEVKGKDGRLVAISKVANGNDARETINRLLGINYEWPGISSTYLKRYVYPLVKNGLSYPDATVFVNALSQHPDTFTTHKHEIIQKVHKGFKNEREIMEVFLAIQIMSYYDASKFDDLLLFSDGKDEYPKCKLFKITGATIEEIFEYGKQISYSGWSFGQSSSIGVALKKSDWLQIEINKYGRMTVAEREEYIQENPEMLEYSAELEQSIITQREKSREQSRAQMEKIKADPARYEEYRKKQREQSKALMEKIKADPVRYAEYKRKQREQSRAALERLKADPVRYAAHREKQREAERKRRLKKKI